MLDRRIKFYSDGVTTFADMFGEDVNPDVTFKRFCGLSLRSPRELIRLMDTLFRSMMPAEMKLLLKSIQPQSNLPKTNTREIPFKLGIKKTRYFSFIVLGRRPS